MKAATSGGTGRNCVAVGAHRCAEGTQPPGAVGYSESVSGRWAGGTEKRPNPPHTGDEPFHTDH
jgi:hypothetical protein